MSTKKFFSFLGKLALLAAVVGVCLLTTTSSASPIPPGFDLFTSNDPLGNSLGLASVSCSVIAGDMAGSTSETLNDNWSR